jgi:hypothetical protein
MAKRPLTAQMVDSKAKFKQPVNKAEDQFKQEVNNERKLLCCYSLFLIVLLLFVLVETLKKQKNKQLLQN